MKWHIALRNELSSWNHYTTALTSAFPHLVSTSRDINLRLLKYCLQDITESFTEYYTLILNLCRKYNPYIPHPQIADWLKAGMKLKLYETLQSENFTTSQALFLLARRLELGNAVFSACRRQLSTSPTSSTPYYNIPKPNYQPYLPLPSTPSYPLSLMSFLLPRLRTTMHLLLLPHRQPIHQQMFVVHLSVTFVVNLTIFHVIVLLSQKINGSS